MKTHLQFFVAAVCLVVLNACATSPAGGSASLAGTWTNSFGTVWTIKPDGTFEVDRNHNGKIDIRGSYSIKGDTFTTERNEGKIAKGCEGPGVYKFNRSGDNLSFTLISDKCKDRKKNVLSPWHKK
jgi:hypothetical protein